MPAERVPRGRRPLRAALIVALAGIARGHPTQAQGGPPLVTDDPGTPGSGHVELNLSFEADRASGATGYDAPRADLNVGAGPRVQLKAEIAWRMASSHGQPTESGLGNLDVGVKWRFVDHGDGVTVSVFPQVTFPGSGSSSAKGVADEETSVLLPVEVAWPVGPVHLNADAGWERTGDTSALILGLAGSRLARPWLELLGECRGEADSGLDGVGVLCGFGGRAELGPPMSVLAAFAWGVSGPANRRLDRRMYLGAQVRR